MKKKLKLAFDQLQNELQILSIDCQKQIQGGVTVEEVIAYYSYLGFQFTQDEYGNYYAGGLSDGSTGDCKTSFRVKIGTIQINNIFNKE